MESKSPGEIVIYTGDYIHRKHLVDSYKYPGEMKSKSPGEIVKYPGHFYLEEYRQIPWEFHFEDMVKYPGHFHLQLNTLGILSNALGFYAKLLLIFFNFNLGLFK